MCFSLSVILTLVSLLRSNNKVIYPPIVNKVNHVCAIGLTLLPLLYTHSPVSLLLSHLHLSYLWWFSTTDLGAFVNKILFAWQLAWTLFTALSQ